MQWVLEVATLLGIFVGGVLILAASVSLANRRVGKIFDAHSELMVNNNFALAFRRAGFLIGIALPISTAISVDHFTITAFLAALRDVVLVIALMFVSLYLSDKFLIPEVRNDDEIKQGNLPTGIIEFGLFIATGLVMSSSFGGIGVWYSSIVFFLMGQVLLIVQARIYRRYILKADDSIQDSLPVAVLLSAFLLSMGIILRASIYGDFHGWYQDLTSFMLWALLGSAILFVSTASVINKLFIPTSSIRQETDDENVAAMFYVGAIKIAISILVANVILL